MKVINALLLGLLTLVGVFGEDSDKDHKGRSRDIIIKVYNKYEPSPLITLETEMDSFNLQFVKNKDDGM